MNFKNFLLVTSSCALFCCNQKKESIRQSAPFVDPPLPSANVTFNESIVDAQKGDTLFYKSGSIVLFPENSFLDKDGNVIKGDVQVKYREFSKPLDFYLAGIPMSYDSAGESFALESTGMCEILAFKDGNPVYVNPQKKPELFLASTSNATDHNVYFLDTIQKNWVYKGRSIVTNSKASVSIETTGTSPRQELEKPLKPVRANNSDPIIQVAIDSASFKELRVYDNMKFQVDASEKNFNPNDSSEEWTNLELQKNGGNGLYSIKFSTARRSVIYAVRPVLEEKDYENALKIFEKKNEEYQRSIEARLKEEKAAKEKYIKDSLANKRIMDGDITIQYLNVLIDARNREIERQNLIIEKENAITIKENKEKMARAKMRREKMEKERMERDKEWEKMERENMQREKEMKEMIAKRNQISQEAALASELYRRIQIYGFGTWNCDKPIKLDAFPLTANFIDAKGNKIYPHNLAVLYRAFNSLQRYYDHNIQLARNSDNMIIGTYNGSFVCLNYDDYRKLNLNAEEKEKTFTMTVISEGDNSYQYIKTLAGIRD